MFERYRRLLSIAVAVTDVLLINLAFAVAYWMRYDLQWFASVDEAYFVPYSRFIPISLALTVLLLGIYKLSGVYNQPRGASWFDEVYRLMTGTATGIILMVFVIVFLFRPLFYSRLIFFYAGVLVTILLGLSRLGKAVAAQPPAPKRAGRGSAADRRRRRGGPHGDAQRRRPTSAGLSRRRLCGRRSRQGQHRHWPLQGPGQHSQSSPAWSKSWPSTR